MQTTLGDLATLLDATLIPDTAADTPVTEARGLDEATPGCVTYIEKDSMLAQALATPCVAVLVPPHVSSPERAMLRVRNPRLAFAHTLRHLHPPRRPAAGVHATAIVDPSVQLGANVSIGPYVLIGPSTVVGNDTSIEAHCWIGADCSVGPGCWLRPAVTLHAATRLGARVAIQSHSVIAGGAEIGDDCELGARVIVETAAGVVTRLGAGTKTDNMLTVGAGATVGQHCLLVAFSCVGEGAVLEDYVTLAGQSAVEPGRRVGTQSILGGRSVIRTDAAPKQMLSGDPAQSHRDELRLGVRQLRAAELVERVIRLEQFFNLL